VLTIRNRNRNTSSCSPSRRCRHRVCCTAPAVGCSALQCCYQLANTAEAGAASTNRSICLLLLVVVLLLLVLLHPVPRGCMWLDSGRLVRSDLGYTTACGQQALNQGAMLLLLLLLLLVRMLFLVAGTAVKLPCSSCCSVAVLIARAADAVGARQLQQGRLAGRTTRCTLPGRAVLPAAARICYCTPAGGRVLACFSSSSGWHQRCLNLLQQRRQRRANSLAMRRRARCCGCWCW
jgi:hypothetical protein